MGVLSTGILMQIIEILHPVSHLNSGQRLLSVALQIQIQKEMLLEIEGVSGFPAAMAACLAHLLDTNVDVVTLISLIISC